MFFAQENVIVKPGASVGAQSMRNCQISITLLLLCHDEFSQIDLFLSHAEVELRSLRSCQFMLKGQTVW